MFLFKRVLLILGLALMLSCSSTEHQVKNREQGLNAAAKSYNENMRWQRYSVASRYIKKDLRDRFLVSYERQRETLNITDSQLISAEMDEDDDLKGAVRVWVTFFRYPAVSLQKELQIQTWVFDEDKGKWFIELPELEGNKPEKPEKSAKSQQWEKSEKP